MTKCIILIFALLFSLNVHAQVRASVSASVTFVDVAGSSFTTDSLMLTVSAKNSIKPVNAEDIAVLGKLNIMGGTSMYSITLPGEPITLSRLSGGEHLTVQSLQLVTTNDGINSNSSIDLIALCKPGKAQAPGYYFADAPVDISINYN